MKKLNEKNAKLLFMIYTTITIVGFMMIFLNLKFEEKILDIISYNCLMVFLVPVIFLQIAMTANIQKYGIQITRKITWCFYVFVFPVIDREIFIYVNSINKSIYSFKQMHDTMRKESFLWMVIIYLSLISIGLIIRVIKEKTKKTIIA